MTLLLGARELGLVTKWRYAFVPFGTPAETTTGTVFVDVGRAVKPGIIDHHTGAGEQTCAAEVAFTNPYAVYNHLMDGWLTRRQMGPFSSREFNPTIVTHYSPDWDAMVACYLVRRLVEDGEYPDWASALVGFSREVDQGRFPLDPGNAAQLLAPHLGYLALQGLERDGARLLERGFQLLEVAVRGIAAAKKGKWLPSMFDPARLPSAADWARDAEFADAVTVLTTDRAKFEEDEAGAATPVVRLPAEDGGEPIPVKAFILDRPPKSRLNKYWVRGKGYPYFVCPYGEPRPGVLPISYPRVVLSLDPNHQVNGRRPTLRGLGYALEKQETLLRATSHLERHGPPRFPGGYCDNEDPWYDGRDHTFTIVDAPAVGSILPYESVKATATSPFWEIPVGSARLWLVYVEKGAQGTEPTPAAGFEGMSPTLRPFYRDTRDGTLPSPGGTPPDDVYRVSQRVRTFPAATAPPFRIVSVEAAAGATLDGLVSKRALLLHGRQPEYAMVRIRLAEHYSDPHQRAALLQKLSDNETRPLDPLTSEGEVVLFNSRTLVFQADRNAVDRPADPELEVLLYAAFVNETLVAFSERLGDQLPAHGQERMLKLKLRTKTLLMDMLRFQSRYYQLDVSRLARGKVLFTQLADSLGLGAHYGEVQQEVERLRELQEQLADRNVQAILYAVSIAGVYQTIIAFFTMTSVGFPYVFWTLVPAVAALSFLVYWTKIRQTEHDSPAKPDPPSPAKE